MPAVNLLIGGFNFTQADSFLAGFSEFASDRNIVWRFLTGHWSDLLQWISQPHIYAIIIAWAVTFTLLTTLVLTLGFGPGGVVAGSLAAAFQGWMYGGFTPAAGIFATLTSLGMLGLLVPPVAGFSAVVATLVAIVVWACGVGR